MWFGEREVPGVSIGNCESSGDCQSIVVPSHDLSLKEEKLKHLMNALISCN